MKNNGYAAYKRTEIVSSSAEQLVPLLFRELLRQLAIGRARIEAKDYEGKADAFSKANAILIELLGSLNVEVAGELGHQLASLYRYYLSELEVVSRRLDVARLDALIELIRPVEEAWRHAAAEVGAGEAVV